jgi:hypothetical protein
VVRRLGLRKDDIIIFEKGDVHAWKNKRNEWAQSIWLHRNDVYG